jgi:hypothetical protein
MFETAESRPGAMTRNEMMAGEEAGTPRANSISRAIQDEPADASVQTTIRCVDRRI